MRGVLCYVRGVLCYVRVAARYNICGVDTWGDALISRVSRVVCVKQTVRLAFV